VFSSWGVPTLDCLLDVRAHCPHSTIIASGGLIDGLDCARAVRMGADLVGVAAGVLKAATEGPEALISRLDVIIRQWHVVAFATGSGTLQDLRSAELLPPHRFGAQT